MRLKSRWFGAAGEKSPAEQASAVAFIIWRVAHQLLKRLRSAGYAIEVGTPYVDVLVEAVVFLATVADRIAHRRSPADARVAFTTALLHHLARILDENEQEFLGSTAGAAAQRLIDLFNEVAPHYAEFGADARLDTPEAGFHPDFGYLRYFASRMAATLPADDRPWVIDQVISVEAPHALALLQRAQRELHEPAPRRAPRGAMNGD